MSAWGRDGSVDVVIRLGVVVFDYDQVRLSLSLSLSITPRVALRSANAQRGLFHQD
jgi:hypothetical protein